MDAQRYLVLSHFLTVRMPLFCSFSHFLSPTNSHLSHLSVRNPNIRRPSPRVSPNSETGGISRRGCPSPGMLMGFNPGRVEVLPPGLRPLSVKRSRKGAETVQKRQKPLFSEPLTHPVPGRLNLSFLHKTVNNAGSLPGNQP